MFYGFGGWFVFTVTPFNFLYDSTKLNDHAKMISKTLMNP